MSLILCGLPMSGKSTIGKKLSQALQWDFIDTDRLIEEAYHKKTGEGFSCRQIFLKEGENEFRKFEKEQISLLKKNKCVVAIGGGALSLSENIQALQALGKIIYLKASLNILWKRIQEKGIPPYLDPEAPEQSFYALAGKRLPLYERVSDVIIEASSLDEEGVLRKIMQWKETIDGQ